MDEELLLRGYLSPVSYRVLVRVEGKVEVGKKFTFREFKEKIGLSDSQSRLYLEGDLCNAGLVEKIGRARWKWTNKYNINLENDIEMGKWLLKRGIPLIGYKIPKGVFED